MTLVEHWIAGDGSFGLVDKEVEREVGEVEDDGETGGKGVCFNRTIEWRGG